MTRRHLSACSSDVRRLEPEWIHGENLTRPAAAASGRIRWTTGFVFRATTAQSHMPRLLIPSFAVALFSSFVPGPSLAQHPVVVRGSITSQTDNRALADVMLQLVGAVESTRSTKTGGCALSIASLPAKLIATRIGFIPDTTIVTSETDTLRIRLVEASLSLSLTTIAAERAYSAAWSSTIRALSTNGRASKRSCRRGCARTSGFAPTPPLRRL